MPIFTGCVYFHDTGTHYTTPIRPHRYIAQLGILSYKGGYKDKEEGSPFTRPSFHFSLSNFPKGRGAEGLGTRLHQTLSAWVGSGDETMLLLIFASELCPQSSSEALLYVCLQSNWKNILLSTVSWRTVVRHM